MYLLDTNHCSLLLEAVPLVLERVAASDQPLTTSVIVRGELRHMVAQSEQRAVNAARLDTLLEQLPALPIDDAAADWYGEIKAALIRRFGPKERRKRRHTTVAQIGVSDNDLWPTATAKAHRATVVSADTDFQRIAEVTDLSVVSWLAPGAHRQPPLCHAAR